MVPESPQILTQPAAEVVAVEKWSLPKWSKIALTVAVLLLLSWQVRWSEILNVLTGASGLGILAAVALWYPNQALQYYRWKFIARRATISPATGDVYASYWLGHTLGFLTPGRIGSYGRGLFLRDVSVGEATALTVLERSYSAITVNGFGLIALAVLPSLGWSAAWAAWGDGVSVILFGVGTMILLTGVFPGPIAGLIARLVGKRKWGIFIANSLGTIRQIPTGSSLLYLALATGSLAVSLVQFILVLDALGSSVPVLAGMLAVHLNFFLKGNIPLTLGNLGVGEWTALLCLRGLGVPDAQAVAASLILFGVNVAIPALVGMRYFRRVFTIHQNWKQRAA
ncbi:MAG: flippase-like domain-containing protein [Calditrichaeota bacterium]|nr:flippase-like domain-containing protein [Calditrichota bacterium]MCB9368284.1 flippase-like domain-containing protein [Calditrichota bacterium]